MANPYVGEIRMFGGNFAPTGWAFCNGRLIAIAQNNALFSLLGTTYGGNGTQTFGLPDLRGRIPIHQGQGPGLSSYVIGELTGAENATVLQSNMPQHNHNALASVPGTRTTAPANDFLASGEADIYNADQAPSIAMSAAVGVSGNSVAHNNVQPILCVNFIIALNGIFPSRN